MRDKYIKLCQINIKSIVWIWGPSSLDVYIASFFFFIIMSGSWIYYVFENLDFNGFVDGEVTLWSQNWWFKILNI